MEKKYRKSSYQKLVSRKDEIQRLHLMLLKRGIEVNFQVLTKSLEKPDTSMYLSSKVYPEHQTLLCLQDLQNRVKLNPRPKHSLG